MTMRWYVVQTTAQFENKVKQTLMDRIATAGFEALFGDILVPTEEVVEMKSGQKRKSERKFFPGYILVKMEMNDETWHLVRHVPRVLGFIGGRADKPSPISDKEVENILSRVQDTHDKPKPKTLFEVGEVVRIAEGPFTDFVGVIEEVNYEKTKVRVSVMIFGRSTPIELGFDQVKKEKM
jgi:transcriptional antiterminator NusG